MSEELVLGNVNVLDFTWWAAGPFTTQYLGAFGALVVKVESPKTPDLFRVAAPFRDRRPGPDRSGMFLQPNTNKHSMTLDLRHPRGLEIAHRLVSWADVVCENFSPGTMDKLGLGYDRISALNPDITMLSLSTAGQWGQWPTIRGHGQVGAALSGFLHLTGYADGEPTTPSLGVADVGQAMLAVVAVLGALDYRARTGRGQHLDLSQIEDMCYFIAPALLDFEVNRRVRRRAGNRHPKASPHGVFPCQGADRWCAIAVFEEEEWTALCRVIGSPSWSQSPRFATLAARKKNEDDLEKLLAERTAGFDAEDLAARLQAAGVPASVVRRGGELAADLHLRARNAFQQLEHPVLGLCDHPTPAVKLSDCPTSLRTAPCFGEHTAHVCCSILGMSDEQFGELLRDGVFG